MAGIKNPSMRDLLPTASERFKKRGLVGLISGPTERDIAIAEAFGQFREGAPPELSGAGPLEGGYVPLEEGQVTPGQPAGDVNALLQNLIGAGPEGVAQAQQIASMFGLGKGEASKGTPFAKINPKDFTQESVATFERTNNYQDLVPREKPTGGQDQSFDKETKLRGEYTKLAGDFRKVRDSYSRIQASAQDPSAAGDLSLIFNYMKMLDPGSVVRESEFATAANSAGVPPRIRAKYNKILRGERLAQETRDDFVNRSNKLFERQNLQHAKRKKTYLGLSQRLGLNPKNVIIDMELAEPEVKPMTKADKLREAIRAKTRGR